MIFNFLINLVVLFIGAIFSRLPTVYTLPTIGGYNIDGALVTGMGAFHTFITAFWPIQDMFYGFLALLTYYAIKMLVKAFLGHRAPGIH